MAARRSAERGGVGVAGEYLERVGKRLEGVRGELGGLVRMGERMAGLLLGGGELFTPGVGGWWVSEFGNRAGGLMGIRAEDRVDWGNERNVAYFAVPGDPGWEAGKDPKLKKLVASKANLFVVGQYEDVRGAAPRSRFVGFTGMGEEAGTMYSAQGVSVRELEQFVRGWVVAGEMIAACTRGGRMPVMWMSVWLEGAMVRNAHFFRHDNLHEPWECGLFHEDYYVPPLKAGVVAEAFLGEAERIRRRLVEQADLIAKAGRWMAEAKRRGKRVWVVAVGHAYPEILELKARGEGYPVEWGASFSDLTKAVPAEMGEGDVAVHLGYAPVNNEHVRQLLARGIRLVHTSPYGERVERVREKGFLYFDLPWRPGDATVDVPGYSVRVLPMSSTAHAMAVNALLAEMAAG